MIDGLAITDPLMAASSTCRHLKRCISRPFSCQSNSLCRISKLAQYCVHVKIHEDQVAASKQTPTSIDDETDPAETTDN